MMTRGEKVIAFIEKFCVTPEGKDVGKPLVLAEFQKRFIKDIYDNPNKTRRAIMTIARKNGKSALIASLLLCPSHCKGTIDEIPDVGLVWNHKTEPTF